ncbi:uncharacterized protein LOC131681210 [Topomyia yanbarensis]|uniref:uncharacterized protein LOC131681210 n=1 Tax=Topomyia yanbarensis TaxID=2498891 RepID=UPI00273CD31F|nr:uncharacterized protein LOC131681210 [Topomyia yanbarensis]
MKPTTNNKTKSLPTSTPTGEVPGPPDEPPAAVGVGPSVTTQATNNKNKSADHPADSSDPQASGPHRSPTDRHKSTNQPADTTNEKCISPLGGTSGRQTDRPPPCELPPRNPTNNEKEKAHSPVPALIAEVPELAEEYSAAADTGDLDNPQATTQGKRLRNHNSYSRSPSPIAGCSWYTITSHQKATTKFEQINTIPYTDRITAKENVREKASSPALALTADVPEITDEPTAAAGAGGPASPRVSQNIPYHHRPQTYCSDPFSANQSSSSYSASECDPSDPPQLSDNSYTMAIQWNINGLRNNLGDLQYFIATTNPVCIALQETHVTSQTDYSSWFSHAYQWETASGVNTHQTIGLGIRNDVPATNCPLNTELIATARTIRYPIECTIVNIYIPADTTNVGTKLNQIIQQISTPYIILGDFNAHHTSWGSARNSQRGNDIMKAIEEQHAIVLNDGNSTFIRGSYSAALDLSIISSTIAGMIDDSSTKMDDGPGQLGKLPNIGRRPPRPPTAIHSRRNRENNLPSSSEKHAANQRQTNS